MGMGCTRVVDRVCAAVGLLQETSTQFEPCLDVPNGGVLWALPALLENGLLRHASTYFSLPSGYYGREHVFLLLATMALARVESVEQLRYHAPGEWGKVLGLDRAPEVKTVRKKIALLAQPEPVALWSKQLSQDWMEADPEAAGVLYTDGHVRTYHGKQTHLPRRYVARQRLCLRGTTDYWVNDQLGRPFFVLTMPVDPGLQKALTNDIVPRLLEQVPNQPSEATLKTHPYKPRFTVIFDREGYSPALFRALWDKRIACQTYHKYPGGPWPESEFSETTVRMAHGEFVTMRLAERGTRLSNSMWVREIRRLTDSDHQTSVLSTNFDSDKGLIAVHMFSRWSQENFFKYMAKHFGLNRLIDYQVESIDETTTVVNPAWRDLDGQVRKKVSKLTRRKAALGALQSPSTAGEVTLARYERERGELRTEVAALQRNVDQLKAQRKGIKKHLPLGELPPEQQFKQLAPTRKRFVDTIKLIAYRAETAMAILLRDVLARPNDAHALLRDIFAGEADLIPNLQEGTLTVRLHHRTNPMADRATQFLANHLNQSETAYPGTNLRLVYQLVSKPIPGGQDV